MLCTAGHNNTERAQYCSTCGVNTFHPGTTAGYNGLAIASMVLGILWLFWIGSVLALIFGLVAHQQIKVTRQSGKGMATAGVVLGVMGIVFGVLVTIVDFVVATRPYW